MVLHIYHAHTTVRFINPFRIEVLVDRNGCVASSSHKCACMQQPEKPEWPVQPCWCMRVQAQICTYATIVAGAVILVYARSGAEICTHASATVTRFFMKVSG